MYSVTIRKMFRHKDGKETLYEDPSKSGTSDTPRTSPPELPVIPASNGLK